MLPAAGGQTRLLAELAPGGLEPVLTLVIQLARGNLQQHLVDACAKLPHQPDVAFAVHGDDGGGADVPGDLALGEVAVGQLVGQMVDVQYDAVEDSLGVHIFLEDVRIALGVHK